MNKKVICAVAGKSGGHIIPALTYVYNNFKPNNNLNYNYDILFFSTDTELDRNITNFYHDISYYVPLSVTFSKLKLIKYPLFILKLIKAFIKKF